MTKKVDIADYYNPVHFERIDSILTRLENFIEMHELNIDPDYQRDHVWTRNQSSKFVGHILEGGKTSPILINTYDNISYEVVDGKQRLTAILRWLHNEIPAIFFDDVEVYFKDIDEGSVKLLTGVRNTIPFGRMKLKKKEVLGLYIRLNRGGTVHTDEEINKVRELLNLEEQ